MDMQRTERGKPILQAIREMGDVDRPTSTRGHWALGREAQAILETAKTGRAVRLELTDQVAMHCIHMALRHAIQQHNVRFRYRKTGRRTLIAWAEALPQAARKEVAS